MTVMFTSLRIQLKSSTYSCVFEASFNNRGKFLARFVRLKSSAKSGSTSLAESPDTSSDSCRAHKPAGYCVECRWVSKGAYLVIGKHGFGGRVLSGEVVPFPAHSTILWGSGSGTSWDRAPTALLPPSTFNHKHCSWYKGQTKMNQHD